MCDCYDCQSEAAHKRDKARRLRRFMKSHKVQIADAAKRQGLNHVQPNTLWRLIRNDATLYSVAIRARVEF